MSQQAPIWPRRPSSVLSWLLTETGDEPYIDEIFEQLCGRLLDEGLPVDRSTLHVRTLHPQFMGATFRWDSSTREMERMTLGHGVLQDPRYLNSPLNPLFAREVDGIRQRLDIERPNDAAWYGIYDDLREMGMVDYVVLPLRFVSGRDGACSFATRRAGGFTTDELMLISDLMPALAMAAEIRVSRRIAKNLLSTYVGPHAGERILRGDITRGSGETIRAAIWHSDVRNFTALSEKWPRGQMIDCLNAYFDVIGEPLEQQDGEILKFMGDGVMAIFPTDDDHACSRALQAGIDALEGMRRLNERRVKSGDEPINIGLTMHLGDVMWGNIGSSSRLDFTVIGPAVNIVSRMQSLNKQLARDLLFTSEFACGCGLPGVETEALGHFTLPGVSEPVEIYSTATRE